MNSKGVPYQTLIFSSIVVSMLILINYSKSLSTIFTYLILTSTFCSLMLYLFISFSEIIISFKKINFSRITRGILSLLFVMWLVIGVGYESIISGLILLSFSIPIYIYQKKYAGFKKD